MKKIIFTSLFLSNLVFGYSQTLLQGRVFDSLTKQPIPFLNIGFIDKNLGTITDKSGAFNLTIPTELSADSICFSHVAYGNIKKKVNDILKDTLIFLKEKNFSFPTLTVTPKEQIIIGKKNNTGVKVELQTQNKKPLSGAEIGSFFKNEKQLSIREVAFYLESNSYDSITIRVRVYDAKDKNNFNLLNSVDKLLTIKNKSTGWFNLSFDLLKDRVIIEDDFMVSIEIIEVLPIDGRLVLKGSYSPFSKNAYHRKMSFGAWDKSPLTLSFYVIADSI